ncbi:MAG: efflux RND transporter periplasmic adaptor subunit [Bacteroidia bacterium]
MRRILIALFLIILIALFAGSLWWLYSKEQEVPVRYVTEQASTETIVKKTVATGKVVPRKEIEIKPRVSGIVDKLYVEPGEVVKAGALIARIKVIPNLASLNAAENRVKLSQLNLKNAQQDYDRNKRLMDEGVIPAANFQQFELAFNNAKQEVEASKDNLDIIRKGTTARLDKAANTLVRATSGGMVLDVPIEEGNSVIEANTFNDGTTIAMIADMDDLIFEGNVDESEVGKIRPGMDLQLTIGAIEDEKYNAKLEYIAPKGVEENGAVLFEIRADLELKKGLFVRANYSANADIVLQRVDSVLAINEALVQFDGDKPFVEVETSEQNFEKRMIKTGLSDGLKIQILEGVDANAKIKNPNKRKG